MRGMILLAVAGAGAYWAYRNGYLPQLAPFVEQVTAGTMFEQGAEVLAARQEARGERTEAIRAASGGRVVPVLGPDEVVAVNEYEAMLRTYRAQVSRWAMDNIGWASAIMRVENAGRNPTISGDNGTSHGVGQVKVATAETCYRAGYTAFAPTYETLTTYAGGIYFATAEMERLSKINPDRDWIIKAYNGGAGWEQMGEKYRRDREGYLVKVKKAFASLYAGSVAA